MTPAPDTKMTEKLRARWRSADHAVVMQYDEYYELSEKSGWRVTDVDWTQLVEDAAAGRISTFDREALLATAVIEHGVPHYAEVWSRVHRLRDDWQLWQFTTLWTGEEHRHSYALKKACELLGMTDEIEHQLTQVATFPFAERQKQSCPDDCYSSVPGMLAYAMIQELATNRFYTLAAKRATSPVLKRLLGEIAADEMRHHVFFRETLRARWETTTDPAWFREQVFRAVQSFKMPHLIYGLQEAFFEGGDWNIGIEMKIQLARCFSFDLELLGRLMRENPVVEPVAAA
ncbi:MAG TPA: acyl-ACP desaturase [Kofleriaceae bacterium]|nr:acyl-ACP desaturase [Kofleriaceae bacterium]